MIKRNIILIVVLFIIGAVIFYLEDLKPDQIRVIPGEADIRIEETKTVGRSVSDMDIEIKEKTYDRAKEFVAPSGFLNTEGPFQIKDLIGNKVVIMDFWTYSCINCQRTFPYLRSWYDKYEDYGLEIVGIHSPEFEFEKDPENVQRAIERFGLQWPVVQDNDFGTWRAYQNHYWPHKYLIDIDGYIVYDHIGEGGYKETEMVIQGLLRERAERLGEDVSKIPTGISEPLDTVERSRTGKLSPEIYFGALRNRDLANGIVGRLDTQTLEEPELIKPNELNLVGEWDFHEEFATNLSTGAKIIFDYQAKDVYMVLSADEPVIIQVLLDGKPVGSMGGKMVDGKSFVTVSEEKLYHIVADKDNSQNHKLELIIENPGLKAFTFTFG